MEDAYCFHSEFEPSEPTEFCVDRHYFLYAQKGTLKLVANGRRWTLPPARAALIRADHPITISVLSHLTSASVLFAPGFMPAPRDVLTVFEMSPLARELVGACRDWGPDSGPLTPYARRLFRTLADVVLQLAQAPSPCVLPAPKSPHLIKAVALTEDQYNQTLTFKEVAVATGQSERALARRFSQEMGMTWSEVLRRIRVIKAVEALATQQSSVTEVALSVGYNSLSAFNAAFRDVTGKTPSQYRASFTPTPLGSG